MMKMATAIIRVCVGPPLFTRRLHFLYVIQPVLQSINNGGRLQTTTVARSSLIPSGRNGTLEKPVAPVTLACALKHTHTYTLFDRPPPIRWHHPKLRPHVVTHAHMWNWPGIHLLHIQMSTYAAEELSLIYKIHQRTLVVVTPPSNRIRQHSQFYKTFANIGHHPIILRI